MGRMQFDDLVKDLLDDDHSCKVVVTAFDLESPKNFSIFSHHDALIHIYILIVQFSILTH